MESLTKTKRVPRRYRDDVIGLTSYYGDLNLMEGIVIEETLQNFGKVCQRDQLKIAAYQGLSSFLQRQYGISLVLSSRKTKK